MSSSESPIHTETSIPNTELHALSTCSSGRRSSASNSPEFEFWMLRNRSSTQSNLLSADVLFVDGVLLPLHLLQLHPNCDLPDRTPQTQPAEPPNPVPPAIYPVPRTGSELSPAITESTTSASASKRWKDIFKKGEKNQCVDKNSIMDRYRVKEKKREGKSGRRGNSGAELNINIWPFSRSRSAGYAGTLPKMFSGALGIRKVNSAPCSRSNSAGESKSRKWTSSPSQPGVHLVRSSPVWHVKRSSSPGMKSNSKSLTEKGFKKEASESLRSKMDAQGGGAVAAGNNGKDDIGHRHHLSCRSDESGKISVIDGEGAGGGNGGGCDNSEGGISNVRNNLFQLRNLFSKKRVLASR